MGIVTLALYGVIKLDNRQPRILGFAAFTAGAYLAIVYKKHGLFYEKSLKITLMHYRSKDFMSEIEACGYNSRKWIQKYIRSIQVFPMDVELYFVQKSTV